MQEKRFLVFGDIHGEWKKFWSLWQKVQPDLAQDELVFLGDYIDRGPDAPSVLTFLHELATHANVHLLRGNHEQMLLDAEAGGGGVGGNEDWDIWQGNGGDATVAQCRSRGQDARDYQAFCASLGLYYQADIAGQPYFFCHAGVDPERQLTQQDPLDLIWIRDPYINGYHGTTTVVTGHTPTLFIAGEYSFFRPIIRAHQIFLDTGSYIPHGRVTCIDLYTQHVWQGL